MWLVIALAVIPSTSFKTGPCQIFETVSNRFNAGFYTLCIVTGIQPTILTVSPLRRSVMSSVTIILMGTLLSMKPWSAWVKTGSYVILWLICTEITVLWMGTQPRRCVILKPACHLLRLSYCVILSKKPLILSLTLMIRKRSQRFYQHVSLTS